MLADMPSRTSWLPDAKHWAGSGAPTLVLWGADDPLLPAAGAAVFRGGIAGARLLLLPRAGHLPMLTRPDEFNRAIVAFLGGEQVGE